MNNNPIKKTLHTSACKWEDFLPFTRRGWGGSFNYFFLIISIVLFSSSTFAQQKLSLKQILDSAQVKHPLLQNVQLLNAKQYTSKLAAINIGPTTINYDQGKFFSPTTDRIIEIHQPLGSPFIWAKQFNYNKIELALNLAEQQLIEKQTLATIKTSYYKCVFQREKYFLLKALRDSLVNIADENKLFSSPTDSLILQQTLALQEISEIASQTDMAYNEMLMSENNLVQTAFLEKETLPADTSLEMYQITAASDTGTRTPAHLQVNALRAKSQLAEAAYKLEKSKFSPQLYAGFFNHSINGKNGYQGWEAGLSVPIWHFGLSNATHEAKMKVITNENEIKYQSSQLDANSANLLTELNKYFERLNYYYNGGLQRADKIETIAQEQFNNKKIDIQNYIHLTINAYQTRLGYLETMSLYNQKAIEMELYAY